MENATKALLIAGGVLIAILLLSLFSYLNMEMASSTSDIYGMLNKTEIAEFNQQFLNYKDRGISYVNGSNYDRNDHKNTPLTVQDVATILNLAQDNNENHKFPTTIEVWVGTSNLTNKKYTEWLKDMQIKNQNMYLYKCNEVHINIDTLLVDKIQLELII